MDYLPLLGTALLVIVGGAIIVGLLILRGHLNETRLGQYIGWIVESAEQQWAHLPGPQRKAWVIAKTKEYFPWVDENLLDILIEAAVLRVNQSHAATTAPQNTETIVPTYEWRGR